MAVCKRVGSLRGSSSSPRPRPFWACPCECFPKVAVNRQLIAGNVLSDGNTRNFTMPHSMASMSEKSLIVHGNKVPRHNPSR